MDAPIHHCGRSVLASMCPSAMIRKPPEAALCRRVAPPRRSRRPRPTAARRGCGTALRRYRRYVASSGRDCPARRPGRLRRPAARPRRMEHHRQFRLAEERYADPAAVTLARDQSGRVGLAVSACQLPLQPRLRRLRRHHRRRMRRMARNHRPAATDHINRNADLGA